MSGHASPYCAAKVLGALEAAAGPGATVRELADLAGVTRRSIHRWRAGFYRTVKPRVADAVEVSTGVPVNLLEGGW